MAKIGVSSEFELRRYTDVAAEVGEEVAAREVRRNVESYNREFIKDIPVSAAHEYYHMEGKVFSEPIPHRLFAVENQIDQRERDGSTYRGFQQFQSLITQGADDERVAVWYSPAGRAGSTPPFSDITYDSGRLYLGFADGSDRSSHVDIKIDERRFPIQKLLALIDYIGGRNVDEIAQEERARFYLENPIQLGILHNEFLHLFHDFAEAHEDTVYVSQRDSSHPKSVSLQNIAKLVMEAMTQTTTTRHDHNFRVRSRADIQELYLRQIAGEMSQNGGSTFLYGCSTTSVINLLSQGSVDYSRGSSGSWDRIIKSGVPFFEPVTQTKKDTLHCTCPGCNKKVWAKIKNNIITCPKCKASAPYQC